MGIGGLFKCSRASYHFRVPIRTQRNPSAQPMPEVTMANFEVRTEHLSGELVVRISGDLDLAAFDEANELLNQRTVGRLPRAFGSICEAWSSSTPLGSDFCLMAHQRAKLRGRRVLHRQGQPAHPTGVRADRPGREIALLRRRGRNLRIGKPHLWEVRRQRAAPRPISHLSAGGRGGAFEGESRCPRPRCTSSNQRTITGC